MKEPSAFQNIPNRQKQMMEEIPIAESNRFRIRYKIHSSKETPIADILWLRKAAKFALKKGFNGFNIVEEEIKNEAIEGVIELEADRMKADFDSHEILDLELPEFE